MTCRIHFYLLNDHFSIEYANEHNNGEPSELNRKYLWEDEFAISLDVTAIEPLEDTTYVLQGSNGNGEPFAEEVPNMRMFYIRNGEDLVAAVGCSEILMEDFTIAEEADALVLSVNLKGEEPLANPVTGIYIASKDFPKSLIV